MAKKGKKEKIKHEEHVDNKNESSGIVFDLLAGILKPLKYLVSLHIKAALMEVKKDGILVLSGIINMITGFIFIIFFLMALNILGIIALTEFLSIKLFFAVLIDAGVNLLLAIIMFLSARYKLSKNLFTRTQQTIKDTFDDIV